MVETEQLGYRPKDQQDREGRELGAPAGAAVRRRVLPARSAGGDHPGGACGRARCPFDPEPPGLATQPVAPDAIRAGACSAATEFTETVAGVVDSIAGSRRPRSRPAGSALGRSAGSPRRCTSRMGSFGSPWNCCGTWTCSPASAGGSLPPSLAGAWRSAEPSARFADLVVTWWGLPIAPTISHDIDGKPFPAAGRRAVDGTAISLRWAVIGTVGGAARRGRNPRPRRSWRH